MIVRDIVSLKCYGEVFASGSTIYELSQQNAKYTGAFQCDASDKREIILDNGQKVNTTLLKIGEFDVIAAGICGYRTWKIIFLIGGA